MIWLFLSDPDDYSYRALFDAGHAVWDGINGALAQKYMREVKKGDRILGYHTSPEKQVVCELAATSDAYQNPKMPEKKNVVVDLKPVRWLKQPVPLAELKAHAGLEQMKLLHLARPVAVTPLTEAEYEIIVGLGGVKKRK